MRFRMKLATMTGAVVLAAASSGAMANAECGGAYGKVEGKLKKSVISEATKACKKGSGVTPAAVDEDKLAKVADKALSGLQKALDKAGDGNCPIDQAGLDAVDPEMFADDVVTETEVLAAAFCVSTP